MFTQSNHRLNRLPMTFATLSGNLLQNLWWDHNATSRKTTETVEGHHHAAGIVKCVKKQHVSLETCFIYESRNDHFSLCSSLMLIKKGAWCVHIKINSKNNEKRTVMPGAALAFCTYREDRSWERQEIWAKIPLCDAAFSVFLSEPRGATLRVQGA